MRLQESVQQAPCACVQVQRRIYSACTTASLRGRSGALAYHGDGPLQQDLKIPLPDADRQQTDFKLLCADRGAGGVGATAWCINARGCSFARAVTPLVWQRRVCQDLGGLAGGDELPAQRRTRQVS